MKITDLPQKVQRYPRMWTTPWRNANKIEALYGNVKKLKVLESSTAKAVQYKLSTTAIINKKSLYLGSGSPIKSSGKQTKSHRVYLADSKGVLGETTKYPSKLQLLVQPNLKNSTFPLAHQRLRQCMRPLAHHLHFQCMRSLEHLLSQCTPSSKASLSVYNRNLKSTEGTFLDTRIMHMNYSAAWLSSQSHMFYIKR